MRILIDIGHPAHVHYYRNLARELEENGHTVFWTVKDIEIAKQLLSSYGFLYYVLPRKADTIIGKIWKQLIYDLIIFKICIQNKIDIAIGTSVSIAHISKISKVKSIVIDDDDDDVQPLVTKYVNPCATVLLSPDSLKGKRKRSDTIFYSGYHELAYLHPARFKPDPDVPDELGIKKGEKYFIMRFNVFKAHHDVGVKGLSLEQKLELVNILKPFGRIFITAEREIEPELAAYQLRIEPEKIHSLLNYATMLIGDSQTMTSEAAVLGVPSIRCNTFAGRISYLEEEEKKYGLTYAFLPDQFESLKIRLAQLLAMDNLREEWQRRRQVMLNEKIDVTSFWSWFISNFPGSLEIIKANPEDQYNFRQSILQLANID
jgi:uncharacterized protein